jgi:hypothetical protein
MASGQSAMDPHQSRWNLLSECQNIDEKEPALMHKIDTIDVAPVLFSLLYQGQDKSTGQTVDNNHLHTSESRDCADAKHNQFPLLKQAVSEGIDRLGKENPDIERSLGQLWAATS